MLPTLTTRPTIPRAATRARPAAHAALARGWLAFAAFALLVLLLAPAARAADDFIPPEQAFRYSTSMQDGTVTVRWTNTSRSATPTGWARSIASSASRSA